MLLELTNAEKETIHYKPGDHLGVFACNQNTLVQGILEKVEISIDVNIPVELQIQKQVHTPNGLYIVIIYASS